MFAATTFDKVLGWILGLGIIGAIFATFTWVTIIALRGTHEYLARRGVGNGLTGVVLAVLGLACFMGLWLPLGLVFLVRWAWRR
jgi:hypothetical protein